MEIVGTLMSHFVPYSRNVDVIAVKTNARLVYFVMRPPMVGQTWPFAQLKEQPQVRVTAHRFKRVRVGRKFLPVIKSFDYLAAESET